MKTLIKKLKLGVLLIGLVILTSCGSEVTFTTEANVNAIYRTLPSLAITATKYTGNKISNYLIKSSAATNISGQLAKKWRKQVVTEMLCQSQLEMQGEPAWFRRSCKTSNTN